MTTPPIMINGGHIPGDRTMWDRDYQLLTADDLAHGIPHDLVQSVEVLITGGEALSNDLVDALPALKLVACFSTGYAGIDLAHLRSRNIALTSASGINAHDVADHGIALMLSLWHGIIPADQTVRAGRWRQTLRPRPSLRGRKAGVVGLGRIGGAIATRLRSLELDVRWWGPRDKPDTGLTRAPSLIELAAWSDILFVASRAVPSNARQIDADVLAALGPDGFLINISRGFLVDEDALRSALQAGSIAGAGLDVFEAEPPIASLWRDMPNCVLTPHLAGYTQQAGIDMGDLLRENVRRYFAREPLLTPVQDAA